MESGTPYQMTSDHFNYLTIDFERLSDRDVYQSHVFDESDERGFLEYSLDVILSLFDEHDSNASFFCVVGELIQDFLGIVKKDRRTGT